MPVVDMFDDEQISFTRSDKWASLCVIVNIAAMNYAIR